MKSVRPPSKKPARGSKPSSAPTAPPPASPKRSSGGKLFKSRKPPPKGLPPEPSIGQKVARTRALFEPEVGGPDVVLKTIVDAIGGNYELDLEQVRTAVRTVLSSYEEQLRVFLISVAKSRLRRILRLMELLDGVEEVLFDPRQIRCLEPRDLVKLYQTSQATLAGSLDYVQRVAAMKAELEGRGVSVNIFTGKGTEAQATEHLRQLPLLSPVQREHVRQILEAVDDLVVEVEPEVAEET